MSRAWSVYTLVLLLLVGLGLFAWMTRQPEAPFFDRAERWWVLGDWIAHARAPYLASARREKAATEVPGSVSGARPVPRSAGERLEDSSEVESESSVWIGIGASLRASARPDAPEIELTRSLLNYPVTDRQGRWLEVRRHDGSTAWYDPDAPRDRTPPLGMGIRPPLPVPAREADPIRLAFARELLGAATVEDSLAGYPLVTDVEEPAVLAELERWLLPVESVYRQRYGVPPIGSPAETVVLFSREEDYRVFEREELATPGHSVTGHASRGLVALYLGQRPLAAAAATLVHEVGHLLNRRALGPALPDWLDEGIAEDLAHFALPGHLHPGQSLYQDQRLEVGPDRILYIGNLGSLAALVEQLRVGALPSLAELTGVPDGLSSRVGASAIAYSQAGFWIRWLVEKRGAEFHRFLRSVSLGEPATGAELLERLEASWPTLDRELEAFLEAEAEVAGLELAADAEG